MNIGPEKVVIHSKADYFTRSCSAAYGCDH